MTAVGKLVLVLGLLVGAHCEVRARDPEVEEEEEVLGGGTGEGRGAFPYPGTTQPPPLAETARTGKWCVYTQQRLVTAAASGTERVSIRAQGPCASGGPGCQRLVHKMASQPLYTQKVLTVLHWACCKGHGGRNCEDAVPDARLDFDGSDVSGGSDPDKQELRAPDVHVRQQGDREQNDHHSSIGHEYDAGSPTGKPPHDEVDVVSHPEATAALPVPHVMDLVMSQLRPVLEGFNRSLELLSRQVGSLTRDVAELKGNWEALDQQPGPELDEAAEQQLEERVEEAFQQITHIQTQMENQRTHTENRLHSQHAMLQYNVTSFKMDVDLKLKRHQKMLQAMNATLSELKLDQDQSPEDPPPRKQQPPDSSALWEAIARLDDMVVNNTVKVSGLMEDVTSEKLRHLERDLEQLRVQMDQTARKAQVQYMMTGLEVEDAKVMVLRRVGELAANLTLQDKRLQEMDVDVDYLYTTFYRNSSSADCNALKASVARLEKAVANVTELATDNRLALDESSKREEEQWSKASGYMPAVEALQHQLQQVQDSLASERSRTTSLNHSLAQLSGSVAVGLAEASGLKDTNRELWEKTQHLSGSFSALLKDASRHSDVLELLLGEAVLDFLEWPQQDQQAHSIPVLRQQLTEQNLKITSLLANGAGTRADQPSASHRPLPGAVTRSSGGGPARERQLLLHSEQGGAGRDLRKLEKMVEELSLKMLLLEEKPCMCANTSTGRAAVDATLQAEVLWLKRGLEHHLSVFKNVFSNADVLARSNGTLELDRLWELVKNKGERKDKRRRGRGGNGSRRGAADVPPAGLTRVPVQFVAGSPQSSPHSGIAFKQSLNQGRFHPETSSFTAPVDGAYLFILTLDLRPGPVHVVLRKRSGGSPVSLHRAEVLEAGPRTGVGLLMLQRGEEVRLELRRGAWLENQDNVFTGLLLHRTT